MADLIRHPTNGSVVPVRAVGAADRSAVSIEVRIYPESELVDAIARLGDATEQTKGVLSVLESVVARNQEG